MIVKVKKILTYVGPFKLTFCCLIYFVIIGVFLQISNAFIQEVILNAIDNNNINVFSKSITYSASVIISSILLMMIGKIAQNHFVNSLTNSTVEKVFYDVSSTEYLHLNNYSSGDIMVRISKNSESFVRVVQTFLFQLTENIMMILLSFYYLSSINIVLSILIVLSGFISIVIGRFFDKKVSMLTYEINEIRASLWSKTKEFFQNIESIHSYGVEDSIVEKDYIYREKMLEQVNKKDLYNNALWSSLLALNDGFMIIVSFVLCYLSYREKSYIGSIFAFVNLIGKVQWPFINISNLVNSLYQDITESERVQEIINHKCNTIELNEDNKANNNVVHDNVFLDININSFFINERKIINNVIMKIPQGSIIGIAGKSGSGKSTIGKIISGLYYNKENINNVSIKICGERINTKTYTGIIYIPQNPHMFLTDIKNNIKVGNLNSTDQEICDVASLFDLDKIRKYKDESLSMKVLENGKNLSGGEIQKIAFARAVLSNAKIIIFDEITSNLDAETEREVLSYIKRFSENKVIFIISHNEVSLKQTNRVYFIDNGSLVDSGSHDYLINENDRYKQLFN